MTNIKQICLGIAVAGVVAGAGSAVGTAVAYADTSDATSSADAADDTNRASQQARPSRGPVRSGPAGSAASARDDSAAEVSTEALDEVDLPAPAHRDDSARESIPESSPVVVTESASAAPAAEPRVAMRSVEPQISVPDTTAVEIPVRTAPPAAAVLAPAPAAQSEPLVAVVVSPAATAAAALTPAPAAPAPVPLRLPLLPELPALPVAPASAVTVSATSGTNSRVRAASAAAQAAVLTDPPTHVLLIGTDGTNMSKILEYAYDNPDSGFRAVMADGVTGTTSLIGHTTISGPSWTTILTGVWDDKSGVINNLFDPEPYKKWPTVINLLEYELGDNVKTAVIADWKYITDIADAGGYPADENIYIAYQEAEGWEAADDAVAAKTIELINATGADESTFIFSYGVAVDEEGHLHGGASPEYRDAVINTSENIKSIMDAVEAWEAATGEEWTVIVTTDHGHQQSKGLGHGFQSPNETSSFIIFDLEGDDNDGVQNLGYQNVDITPTIVDLFGVDQRSDFDGVPLTDKAAGIVDPGDLPDLKVSLNNALGMYGYPNIGVDIALGTRTVFASVPYIIDGLVTDINDFLQGIVDQDIFLISGLADISQWIVQFNGNLAVGVTQAVARVVAYLTGAGVIPPSDPPLPAPPADSELPANSELPWLLDSAVLA
ncbi:alkaline phosphatase family protein [Mycolicibacterium sp.]|uniref:alkaline phosphatase family protein n=1 Tax=Mycolicibacterium sp. TaxID=2320850 RepID=UPI0028AD2E46|nr:alkaline phosphatase family protein [Mycolicibacterium sp.]